MNRLVLLALFFSTAVRAPAGLAAGGLRCEHLENPQGIDAAQPRLSWMLHSSERGVKQAAYQILVASSAKQIWRTTPAICGTAGKFGPDESMLVAYAGKPLGLARTMFLESPRLG